MPERWSFCLHLPSAWKKGYIHGIMARGGFQVDIDWENGKLKQAKIISKLGNPLKVSYAGREIEIAIPKKERNISSEKILKGIKLKQ